MPPMDMRQPPRFVPTLTDVVAEPLAAIIPAAAPPQRSAAEQEGAEVDAAPLYQAQPQPHGRIAQTVADTEPAAEQPDWSQIVQTLQSRVLNNVEASLQAHLGQALQELLQSHTQAFYQAIRSDIEHLVHTSVQEALAQELEKLHSQHPDK